MTANSLMTKKDHKVYLVRHGETEWSLSGQHTGVTDIPLTENGRAAARFLQPVLVQESFDLVLTSPLARARETCELAGLGDHGVVEADLMEWNYGEYEGLTPLQIHARRPKWMIFRDGCPGGESPRQIAERADRVIAKAHATEGNVALFAHGHIFPRARGTLDWPLGTRRPAFPARHCDLEHSWLLPRRAGIKDVECPNVSLNRRL